MMFSFLHSTSYIIQISCAIIISYAELLENVHFLLDLHSRYSKTKTVIAEKKVRSTSASSFQSINLLLTKN